jgi:hypothetical protein
MIQIPRARTTDEYVDLIKQALFEVEDLYACLEWDYGDDALQIQRTMPFLDPLATAVRTLHQSLVDGSYQFATGEQPFMELLRRYPDQLPFAHLLERINATHCEGLDVADDWARPA